MVSRRVTTHAELLRKEFSIGVGLDHPHIVRLLDFGYMDAIGWYIQMEYIDGITLEQFLADKPSAATRRNILLQLLDALSFLHERQIIHRDIKPSNILIARNGSTVKLIDFGVSDTDDYVTFKQPAGSMAYIAPEQLAGQPIDNRADIYAVGKIIRLLFQRKAGKRSIFPPEIINLRQIRPIRPIQLKSGNPIRVAAFFFFVFRRLLFGMVFVHFVGIVFRHPPLSIAPASYAGILKVCANMYEGNIF